MQDIQKLPMLDLAGIYAPIPTPFDQNEALALGQLERNLAIWAEQPLAGLIVPGSNSEAAYLTLDERRQLWRTCAPVLHQSGKQLIAGTGLETTLETIELTQQAAELGADAVLVLPPSFYRKQMTDPVLLTHYQAVADAAPIPILVYNVPMFTGVDLSAELLIDLADHFRIVGVKDSSANVVKMAQLLAARPDFQVFAGSASALLPFLSIGAKGTIAALANIASSGLWAVWKAFQAGQLTKARQTQLKLVALNQAVTARFGVPGLKYALDQIGLYGGPVRRPLLPLGSADRAEIDNLLQAAAPTIKPITSATEDRG